MGERRRVKPSEHVADAVRARIEGGEWQPGEALPSAAVLADEYAVSRSSAARAMKVLEAEGLVEIEPKWGVFLSDGATGGP